MDGQTYAVRLRDLEQKVDDLKEQIRRSHTKLSLLSDTVLASGSSGSRADIQFKNEMSSAFRLTKLLVVLDGAVQANKLDETGALSDQPMIPVFAGAIPPGDHALSVLEHLQGNGYGVFSYLKGYKFEVRSSHSFTATEGKTITLSIIAYEKLGSRPLSKSVPRFDTPSDLPRGFRAGPALLLHLRGRRGRQASLSARANETGASTSFSGPSTGVARDVHAVARARHRRERGS